MIIGPFWLLLFLFIQERVVHDVGVIGFENYVVHNGACELPVSIMCRIFVVVHLDETAIF